jgi:hypothetical protein
MESLNMPNPKLIVSGTIIDAFADLPEGSELITRFATFPPDKECAAFLESDWTFFGSALLSVSFVKDGAMLQMIGSAVLIAPGLAVGAKHVFEPLNKQNIGSSTVYLSAMTGSGVIFWIVRQILVDNSDVVLIRIDLSSLLPECGFVAASMTTRYPRIGEKILILGFRSEVDTVNGAPVKYGNGDALGCKVIASIGEVSELYPNGRDSCMLPQPCIEVSCETPGGMSGGPAFDKNGRLLGVLSSSVEGEKGPSFVSLMWSALCFKIDTIWPRGLINLPTNLLEMSQAGLVDIEGANAISKSDAPGSEGALIYMPWP